MMCYYIFLINVKFEKTFTYIDRMFSVSLFDVIAFAYLNSHWSC